MMWPATGLREGGLSVCVAGASGFAGSACAEIFVAQGWQVTGFSRRGGTTPGGLPVEACSDDKAFEDLLQRTRPDLLLVASGVADLEACERDPLLSQQANIEILSGWLANVRKICPATQVVLLSSIYVFGEDCPPQGFCETDLPAPLSVYGLHKLRAERMLQTSGLDHLIVRLPWLIGNPAHSSDPVRRLWRAFREGETAVDDGLRFPTDVRWVAQSVATLIREGVKGVVHLSAAEPGSRFDLMAHLLGGGTPRHAPVLRRESSSAGQPTERRAPRPDYLKLGTIRSEVQALQACPPWQQVSDRYAGSLLRQLLVDVSDLACADRGTGIQRVVKSILSEWLSNPPLGFRVEPVYLIPGAAGYRYARSLRNRYAPDDAEVTDEDPVVFGPSDILLGLDLLFLNAPLICDQNRRYVQSLRAQGVNVRFVVYDLLPVRSPEYFPAEGLRERFVEWLRIVSEANGAVCVSRAVVEDLKDWLGQAGWLRSDFVISYFHNGADIENTPFSCGLPDSAAHTLAQLSVRPSFLLVGTIEPRKGQRQMLDAFEWLWAQGVDANLVFVGQQGWMVDALVERMRQHPEKGRRFFWLEGISDEYLLKVYRSVSCLMAASEGEGFGLPTVEAVRVGLPIIARDLTINREICGEFARYFSSDAAADFGSFILQWLQDWRDKVVPNSSEIKLLTWRESAAELFRACTA